jgi:sporulation protein YlmC with PRC-barrel domain
MLGCNAPHPKYILVKHNHVSSIGDVMIIDKIVAEHLERYSTPGSA